MKLDLRILNNSMTQIHSNQRSLHGILYYSVSTLICEERAEVEMMTGTQAALSLKIDLILTKFAVMRCLHLRLCIYIYNTNISWLCGDITDQKEMKKTCVFQIERY